MTRADRIAAALERVAEWKRGVRSGRTSTAELIDALAALLREPQPEPALEMVDALDQNDPDVMMTGGYLGNPSDKPEPAPVVGDDEAEDEQ